MHRHRRGSGPRPELTQLWIRLPPQSIQVLMPSSEIPELPTPEETYAEVRRRGLLPVLELVAEEMEREDRGSHHRREAEDPSLNSRSREAWHRATNKDARIGAPGR